MFALDGHLGPYAIPGGPFSCIDIVSSEMKGDVLTVTFSNDDVVIFEYTNLDDLKACIKELRHYKATKSINSFCFLLEDIRRKLCD